MGVASAQVSAAGTCGSLHISGKSVEVGLLPLLPATLSLASPMVRSRLSVPSLLGLFGALLMLSPELLVGNPEGLSDLPFSDPGVYRAYTFAVEQYNQDRSDSTTFFKVLQFLRAQSRSQVTDRVEYCLKLELVKTVCKKMAGRRGIYKHFEKCKQFPSTQEKPTCFFKVTLGSSPNERNLEKTACSTSGTPPPNDLFCSG